NARLFDERTRQIAELDVVNRISRAATASLNLTDLASEVYEVLRQVLPVDAYYLAVYNPTFKQIVASVLYEGDHKQDNVLDGPLVESSLTGWIVTKGQPLLFSNMLEEAGAYEGLKPRVVSETVPQSWLGVPLQSGEGEIRGVLSIQHTKPHIYGQRDVELLKTVANQLAVAVENARLYGDAQLRLQELALVNRVGSLTNSTLDLVEIMQEVHRALNSVFSIDSFYSFVYDPVHQEIELRLNVDEGKVYIDHQREKLAPKTASTWIIQHQQPLLFRDMPAEMKGRFKVQRFGNTRKRSRSWVGVPLKIGNETSVGLISIQSYTPDLFGERELALLQTVASQVALAVQNARLFKERERQIRELDAIGQIGQIMSASFDLDEVLYKTAQQLESVTGASIFMTMIYDPEANVIVRAFAVEEGIVDTDEWQGGPPTPGSLTHWILSNRAPLVIRDITDTTILEERGITPVVRDTSSDEEPRSWIGVPILAKDGAPIGTLSLQDYAIGKFDDQSQAFLTNVASHMSLGLQKVQLFRDRDRQIRELDVMRRIGQVTSSTLDMNELMRGVYRVLREFLPVDNFVLNIYDPQLELLTNSLLVEAGRELPVPPTRPVNPHSLTGWMLAQRRPLLLRKLDEDLKDYPEIEPLQHDPNTRAQSWLGVPLQAKSEQAIGILAVQNLRPNMFDERDMQFLTNVANQVTLGVQNVRLYEQTEQNLKQLGAEAERLALINHVSNQTASTLDPQVLYDLAVEEMAHATGANQARLLIFDFEHKRAITRAEYPYQGLTVEVPVEGNLTIPWLQQHRRPLVINDVDASPLTESFRNTLRDLGIVHMLIVPLTVNGEIIGSVGLDSTRAERDFTARDAETCQTIANQVAQALENARLFAETERQAEALSSKVGELSVLLEAGQALSSLREPAQVLETLVRLVARQLQVDTVILSTLALDNSLVPAASLGLPDEFVTAIRVQRGQGLIGRVAETGQPLAIADVQKADSQYPAFNSEHGLTSFLGVPVLYRNEVTGVLSVMTNLPRDFDNDETALLSALADQAAIALENARLFTERERQIAVLQALNEVAQAVTSTLDRDALLRQLHTKLGQVIDTRSSMIALYDGEKNQLQFPVVVNDGRFMDLDPLPLAEGSLSQVVRNRRTIALQTPEEAQTASRVILGGDRPIGSWIGVPITSGDQVLGIINIQSPQSRAFPIDTIQFLQAVASQAGIALENARLFAERERQIEVAEALSTIGQVITATLTPEELAQAIMTNLGRVLDTATAYIAFYDSRSNNVTTTVGQMGGAPFQMPRHTLTGSFLQALLWEHQQPVLTNNAEEVAALGFRAATTDPRRDAQPGNEQSVLAAPIMSENVPLGAIVLTSEQTNAFDRADLQFLVAAANQSSNAIQKAVFFSDLDRHLRELEALNRVSQAVTSTISLDEILLRLHEGLSEIIDTSNSFIGLYDENTKMISYPIALDRGTALNWPTRPLSISATGWSILNRQPLLLNTHEEMNEYRDEAARRNMLVTRVGPEDEVEQSYLIVPIMVGNSVLGVINIQSYQQYAFSEFDMSFVSTVAAQAATSIANARLFAERERSIQQLRTLNMIGQALGSTVRFEDLLRVIYEQTTLLLDTTNFYMALYDERRREVTFPLFFEHGEPVRIDPQRDGAGLTEYIIKKRQPLLLQGGKIIEKVAELGIEPVGDISQSWLGIPMIAADKVVGVMSVQNYDHDNAYTEDDVQLLSTVANQVAQALENARLFSESRESVRELSTLSETSVSLASTLEIDELLAISSSSALEMARADFGGIILVEPDDDDNDIITSAMILNRDRMEMPVPTSEEVDLRALKVLKPLREGQVVQVYDARAETSLNALAQPLGLRGVVFLPMLKEGLRGVVFVAMDQPYVFEDRSIASLLILTTQIGQALDNAQLFAQIRHFNSELEAMVGQRTQALAEAYAQLTSEKERVEALYNIATELGTTLDRSELLVRTLDLAAQALNVNRGSVMLLDRETKVLTCEAILNEEVGLRSLDIPVRLEQGEGLANWVLDNSEGVVIEDVRNDKRWVTMDGRSEDVRSVIAVPLLSSETPQGVLMLSSTQIGYFTQDHLRFLSTIGGEVSSALHNADLYALVYESADRLSDAMWQQREEASKTAAILQSVSEGVIVLDHVTEKIILYNPAAESILKIPATEVYGNELTTFAIARDEDEENQGRALLLYTNLKDGIQAVQSTEETQNQTIDLPGQNLAANFALVTGADESRFGVVIVVRDITREIEADRAKRDFIATVSHELRTPLTPIRGFVDLLMLGALGQLSDPQKEALTTVKNNTMRMLGLVEDLLEIGRLEAGKIMLNTTPSNLNQLVRDTVGTWQLELERKRMTLDLELDDSLPQVEYDTKRIGQVFTNLVSNAIKYTKDGGAVWVRTFRNKDGMIQVDVQDTGVGLKPEDQRKLFQRFYRADSELRDQVGGTGLGLSIAKSFVELHGGDMWVSSVAGEGSTFSFSLPVHQPRPELGESEDLTSGIGPDSAQAIEEATT
ncbi:MAG TPA: GAF domain-containing protein, partial [Herpetosiphonaceae bacterium]